MSVLVPGHNGNGKINRWEKGESGNPSGRPRNVIRQLKENGYKNQEIVDSILFMITLTESELKQIKDNETSTILEKMVSNALLKGYTKGSLYALETLLTRALGKPKETTQVNSDSVVEVIFTKGKTIL